VENYTSQYAQSAELDYLRSLQSNFNHMTLGDVGDIINYRKDQLKLSDKSIDAILNSLSQSTPMVFMENFYKEDLIDPILELLPAEVKVRLENVVVGFLPTYRINASAIKCPNGKPLVILHTQLLAAISHYNEAQYISGTLMSSSDEKLQIEGERLLIESYQEIVKCFRYHAYAPKMSILPNTLDKIEHRVVLDKTLLHELFIILHEFAHIYLGHLDRNFLNKEYCFGQISNIQEYVRTQQMELDADLQAANWMIEVSKNPNIIAYPMLTMLKLAPYIAFECFMMMHFLEINANRNRFEIGSGIERAIDREEATRRIIQTVLELEELEKGTVSNIELFSHPKALIRLMNVILNLSGKFDKDINNFLFEMIYNAVYFESFAIGDGLEP